jgi:hypothetical protein
VGSALSFSNISLFDTDVEDGPLNPRKLISGFSKINKYFKKTNK